MTDADDHDLERVDRAARAASHGLQEHVDRQVDPELVLAALPASTPSHRRGRLLAAAAVVALVVGSVAVLSDDAGDDSRLEVDEDGQALPTPEPGSLTLLGPQDGRDSIALPITVAPSTGLADGDVVTVTGPGFVPGEQVGIVQCAGKAGDGPTEQRARGIDGCQTAGVAYANANDDGVATGTYTVHRIVTTPATGTVDCAHESARCIVAMGAISDYDRSGGFEVSFAGGGEPVQVPTMSLDPSTGLADGDAVHVVAEGLAPNSLVVLQVCSADPAGCWQTGEVFELDAEQYTEAYEDAYGDPGIGPGTSTYMHVGLVADGSGRAEGDVPVWRFLPADRAGRYIDCAVSACTLRLGSESGSVPEPAPLAFTPGGTGPDPAVIAVDPTDDLEPGQTVAVRGAGFEPGSYYSISLCASPVDRPDEILNCMGGDSGQEQIDGDGGFAIEFELPYVGALANPTATTRCSADGECTTDPPDLRCDGREIECSIRVDSYHEGQTVTPPQFPPVPVPITLRQ